MKKFVNLATYTLFLLAFMAFTSCQSEFEEVNTSDTQGESFAANSSTALLIENTARLDGSFDNIVDGSSCIALNVPYSVNVNGIDLVIDSREDLHLIEEIFDEFEEDDDILEIIFPITITTKDLDEFVIEGPDAQALGGKFKCMQDCDSRETPSRGARSSTMRFRATTSGS